MAGTSEGARKAREKFMAKYGGEGNFTNHMRTIGASGGKAFTGEKGFATTKHLPETDKRNPVNAGRVGGSKPRMCKICMQHHGRNEPCV